MPAFAFFPVTSGSCFYICQESMIVICGRVIPVGNTSLLPFPQKILPHPWTQSCVLKRVAKGIWGESKKSSFKKWLPSNTKLMSSWSGITYQPCFSTYLFIKSERSRYAITKQGERMWTPDIIKCYLGMHQGFWLNSVDWMQMSLCNSSWIFTKQWHFF